MATAAVVEFQRAQSLISTDRDASIDILHSIGKWFRVVSNISVFSFIHILAIVRQSVPRREPAAAVLTHCTV